MLCGLILKLAMSFLWLAYNWIFGYWDMRNVFNVKWEFNLGPYTTMFIKKKFIHNTFKELYEKYKNKGVMGFYSLFTPMLLIMDPELAQTVLVRDFKKFADGGTVIEREGNQLFSLNPFNAKGIDRWKELRGVQSSSLTVSKFREMTQTLHKVAQNMINLLIEKKTEPTVVKNVTFAYTVDNATACGFGIEPTAFTDPQNEFIKYTTADKMFYPGPDTFFMHIFSPTILNKILRKRVLTEESEQFFKTLSKNLQEQRKKSKIVKNDLVNTIIKSNQKRLEDDKPEFDELEKAAFLLTFYVDATDTTSNQLGFLLICLAENPIVQERLRKEIASVSKNPEDFDYDKINSINYLTMVLNESMRLHPAISWLTRTCTQDTDLGNISISKGTKVFIPIASFHNDPEYFPDPKKFDPERFSEENENSILKSVFLPFGTGPRMCVGYKFAILQIKFAIVYIILKFEILPLSVELKMKFDEFTFLSPDAEMKLTFKPIDGGCPTCGPLELI